MHIMESVVSSLSSSIQALAVRIGMELRGVLNRISAIEASAVLPASAEPKSAGTADVGSSAKYAREDHRHPAQTSVSGNAGTATKLATARTISLSGDATGSASFDGSANKTIAVTLADSGVTADSYGPTAAATLSFGGSVNVPQVTVDDKGRVTGAVDRTIKLPAAPTSVSSATNATKWNGASKTVSTAAASGGSSGDIWFQYIA